MEVSDKLLVDLETIASIPRGRRINTSKEFINIESEALTTSVWRAINHDSRDRTVAVVCSRIQLAIFITELLIEGGTRTLLLKRLHIALYNCMDGVNNLCDTYLNDVNVVANLRPLIDQIRSQVSCIGDFLETLGEHSDPRVNELYLDMFGRQIPSDPEAG